jgi:hypothetical protein
MLRRRSDGCGCSSAPCACCSIAATPSWWRTYSSGSRWPSSSASALHVYGGETHRLPDAGFALGAHWLLARAG